MKGRIEGVIFFLFLILNAESRIEYPGRGDIEIRVKRKIGARQTPSVSTQGEGIDPSPFNAKNRSFFPAHCSRFAFCSRRSSIRLAVATTPAMGTISRWTMISVSRIFLLLSLSFSPSLLLPLLHTSHGLLRARYHGRSVAVWSIGHVISIKNRWQRNRWCIDSNDPPSDSNYFSFYSPFSLSVHTQRDTGGIYIFHSIDFTLDGDRITWTCNDISVASDPLQLSRRFFVRWKLVRNIGQIFVKCNVR